MIRYRYTVLQVKIVGKDGRTYKIAV